MAGEKAFAAGMPILDSSVDKVRDGAMEINFTRDLIAERSMYGPSLPGTGEEGQIFHKLVT